MFSRAPRGAAGSGEEGDVFGYVLIRYKERVYTLIDFSSLSILREPFSETPSITGAIKTNVRFWRIAVFSRSEDEPVSLLLH